MNFKVVNSLVKSDKNCCQRILYSMILLFVVACDSSDQAKDIAPEKQAPQIELTADGVKGISAEIPFTKEAIRSVFPHREVIEKTYKTEGEAYTVIEVREEEQTLLSISPDSNNNVGKVGVKSAKVVNQLGSSVGSSFADVYKNHPEHNCSPGFEEPLGIVVICPIPEVENIVYIFEGKWKGPDSELPPPSTLKSWQLTEIVWKT